MYYTYYRTTFVHLKLMDPLVKYHIFISTQSLPILLKFMLLQRILKTKRQIIFYYNYNRVITINSSKILGLK